MEKIVENFYKILEVTNFRKNLEKTGGYFDYILRRVLRKIY